jgi:hypothetical protein
MEPFQTDAAITSPPNKYGNSVNYRLKATLAIRFLFDTRTATTETKWIGVLTVSEASEKLGMGRPQQASLQGETGAAERSPRRLSTHQKAVLVQVLLAFPDQTVALRYLPSASDALCYADDFLTIFRAINWTVTPAEPAEDLPYSSSGLSIVVPDEKLPASAEALRDALRIYGTEAQFVKDPSNLCGPSGFALAVTRRP